LLFCKILRIVSELLSFAVLSGADIQSWGRQNATRKL
jgi:hypothetical protein